MATKTEIILHCAATREGKYFDVDDIDQWHRDRGFRKIGYHYVVLLDGTVQKGRDDSESGAHTIGHNKHGIGVCYIGGIDKNNKPKDTRTPQQKQALVRLVKDLMKKYNIDANHIHGHYEFANKACPSFKIETFKQELLCKI